MNFESIRQRFSISYAYNVVFTEKLFDAGNALLRDTLLDHTTRQPVPVLFVVDQGVVTHHPSLLERIEAYVKAYADDLSSPEAPLVVPGGEQVKNDPIYTERVQKAIFERAICRHSYVVAIGGGAVLDMAGFAAATAHRGVRHVRVPTTVLSQNDSGVGVKNGINAFGSKNFLGTFAPPVAVINDPDFLSTLDDRDWRGGISEAIKVALIKDAEFFEFIENEAGRLAPPHRHAGAMQQLIYRCAAMHVDHIAAYGDPFESGSSRPLDFGHWAAHKLEGLSKYTIRHGEAVAIGIALDCVYAHQCGMLDSASLERILGTFEILGFSLFAEELEHHTDDPAHQGSLFRGIEEFREHLGGVLTIMLLEGIGHSVEVHDVDLDRYRTSIQILKHRAQRSALRSNGVMDVSQ